MAREPADPVDLGELRALTPQVLAAIVRRFGDFGAAEDAVQEALIAAATRWPVDGRPDNPRGWLIQVAAHRMVDHVRAETARRRREAEVGRATDEASPAAAQEDSMILLFMCCHPALTRPSAIALTLRAVGGLTTAEIARGFLVPEATMAQRISRAKQTIAQSGVGFEMPGDAERAARLAAVLHVLYLIFNEGYAASAGPSLARVELSSEAIRLTRAVLAAFPDEPDVLGLLALMRLTDARRPARSGPDGALIALDEQDRGLWDRAAIAEGVALVSAALGRGPAGAYQLQAAIAAVHDEAPRVEDTDWPQIVALYGVLRQLADNPMVELNHAIAVAMVDGPAAGLARLAALDADPRIAGHYRLAAVRGHLHERAGDPATAIAHYRAAASRTTSVPERNYLIARLARLTG